ncbi:hypothetical protein BIV25_20880 [Streptomyces sp. MUSC 14]|nr:hypothetical protein BIV25_20880 [Streptomyces sp. MUSC 14]
MRLDQRQAASVLQLWVRSGGYRQGAGSVVVHVDDHPAMADRDFDGDPWRSGVPNGIGDELGHAQRAWRNQVGMLGADERHEEVARDLRGAGRVRRTESVALGVTAEERYGWG